MGNFFTQASNFFKGLFGFVQAAAPVAEEVGSAIGDPSVVAGAKAAEAISAVGEKASSQAPKS